ncbi:MAG: cadmium-translocating P-type ATPase [Clostridia bacterium]|nr:cadmium-translocating P-type ATPase [Clostridia bacterium]
MKIELSKKDKGRLLRIILSLIIFVPLLIADKIFDIGGQTQIGWALPCVLYFTVYIIIGYDVLYKAVVNVAHLNPLDENFLMCIATLGAFALAIYTGVRGEGTEGFEEGCAVLIFYQIGELFQSIATEKSRRSIASLMDICPDFANVIRNGIIEAVLPEEVSVGETVVVRAGEKVPLDGEIISGVSSIDSSSLTGESVPVELSPGDKVISGCINLTSTIEIRVEKEFTDSTVSKILELVENASDKKSKTESFITKFARWYTPVVVALAICLAVIPTLVFGDGEVWIYRSLSFLVVSCPCAIVISVPMAFFMGIGTSSKSFILVKGSDYIEKLDKAKTFVFDKTGTLTTGEFQIVSVYPEEKEQEILRLAAIAEVDSIHPIAKSIVKKYGQAVDKGYTTESLAGYGIIARNNNDEILCGSYKLMEGHGIACPLQSEEHTAVYVAHNGLYIGVILIADEIKKDVKKAVSELKNMGVKCVMLTGDREESAKKVAESVGISDYRAALLPQNKVYEVERLMGRDGKDGYVCFVGDGINDAPVLMRSDIGISMGSLGSDAAIEASNIVLTRDDITSLVRAKSIARGTVRIAKQNIIIPLFIKIGILILSTLGIANMWMAVFGDVGVAVLAILNSMRIGRIK